MKEKNIEKNILVIVVGMLVLSEVFKIRYFYFIGFLIGLLSIISPIIAIGIDWVWGKLGGVLGWVNSKILLTVLYFVILLPIAFIRKFFDKNLLQLGNPKSKNSLYIERNYKYDKKDLADTW